MSAGPVGLLVAVRKHPGIEMPGYFQSFLWNESINKYKHRRH